MDKMSNALFNKTRSRAGRATPIDERLSETAARSATSLGLSSVGNKQSSSERRELCNTATVLNFLAWEESALPAVDQRSLESRARPSRPPRARREIAALALGSALTAAFAASHAQDFPSKPIHFVTGAAGASSDTIARLVAQGISGPLGQPVVVENRSAGLTGEIVSKALPDGYTLLVSGSTLWIGPLLQPAAYDPLKDLTPVTLSNRASNVLVVHPSLPAKSVRDLIALARDRPGELNASSGATGGASHLALELFKSMAKVNIVRVPYKSGAQESVALLGGEVQLTFTVLSAIAPHLTSGRLRPLAVSGSERSPLLPNLPTIAGSGLPGYESGTFTGIFAPTKTSAAIINRLNQEIVRFVKRDEGRERFLTAGVEPLGTSPDEAAGKIKTEIARLAKVIKEAGIRLE
jgi:tripartite-type tricarboxylate transporter receptor subunit TctC